MTNFRNEFYNGWRWSDTQRVWWRFLWAPTDARDIEATVEVHGVDYYVGESWQHNYRPYLRLTFLFQMTLMIALPRFLIRFVGGRRYGVRYCGRSGFLSVFYGRETHDSSTDKSWHCHTPWQDKRFHARRYYDLDGNLVKEFPARATFDVTWAFRNSDALPKRSYRLKDYDGEEVYATVYVEERHWKHGTKWCCWLSWFIPDKKWRSVDLAFSTGIGRKKDSWKGGTIGHSTDLNPGESVDDAMKRYCHEHELELLGILKEVYVPPPRPKTDEETAQCVNAAGAGL